MNIAMILSGGVGNRFGAGKPKQYCELKGRPVIEYAIDACRLSKKTDKIIIVASGSYVQELAEKYGIETTAGGKERNNSVKNGLDYIAARYPCEKVVMVDAVSPLTTEEQIDRYFDLLDEYDYILTAQKVTSSLHRYDGQKVMRDHFFHTLEPEAYNFRILYENFDGDHSSTTVYHQMPETAKGFPCFDYPYNMKLTYAFDMKLAEILLEEVIQKPKQEATMKKTALWLGSLDSAAADKWLKDVWDQFGILKERWAIKSYHVNPQSFTGVVVEGVSEKYGNVIVKFDAPLLGRYEGECFYYRNAGKTFMAELLDYDDAYHAMLLKQVYPGQQVKFDPDDQKLRQFYDAVAEGFVAIRESDHPELKTVLGNFKDYVALAKSHDFEKDFRQKVENMAFELWKQYFQDAPTVLLHMDLHRRNILSGGDTYRGIDCQGVLGPYEFEFTRMFVIDNKDDRANTLETCRKMFEFCVKYADRNRLNAALFIEWVFLMDEFVFADNDDYQAAAWAIEMIKTLFYPNGTWRADTLPVPQLFQ